MASTALRMARPKLSLSVPPKLGPGSINLNAVAASSATSNCTAAAAPRSPFPSSPLSAAASGICSPSPRDSPTTARNTLLNQTGAYFSPLLPQGPPSSTASSSSAALVSPPVVHQTFAYKTNTEKSILKRGTGRSAARGASARTISTSTSASEDARKAKKKSISFDERPKITITSPMPEDYYGAWSKMSRDDRRWLRLL